VKFKSLFKAYCAQHTGGVINKGQRVENPHQPLMQVIQSSPVIVQVAKMVPIQPQRHGVYGKVTPMEI